MGDVFLGEELTTAGHQKQMFVQQKTEYEKVMLYDNYFHSISDGEFDLQSELQYAEHVFKHYYQPHIKRDSSAKIFEVGCGFGKILSAAKSVGYSNVEGVDISQDQVAFAKERLGLKVEKFDAIERLRGASAEFDCIMIIDVLEHCELEYSRTLLKVARTALKPNGVILVQVPNGLSPLAPTFIGDVTHLRAFSPQSLGQLFRLSGLRHFSCHAMYPIIHGPVSAIRYGIWRFIITPLILIYMLVTSGGKMGGIFTPNIIAVAGDE